VSPLWPSRVRRRASIALAVLLALPLFFGTLASDASAKRKLRPKVGRTVVVSPAHGSIRVKARGSRRYKRLRRARTIRLGSTVDATNGQVRLRAASGSGIESGVFSDGAFVVTQTRTTPRYVELRLVGGRPEACAQASGAGPRAAVSPRVIRRLRARARGHFRTRGGNAAATVRGTTWLTEDRCDGTVITSQEGTVDTTTQLGSQDFQLQPGQSVVGYCVDIRTPNLTCVVEQSDPAKFTYLFAIGTVRPATQYQLCVISPAGVPDCGTFPLQDTNGDGIRTSGVGCVYSGAQDGVGDYSAQWNLDGTLFGPLFFTAPLLGPNTTESCIYVTGSRAFRPAPGGR
jgi:hypothetical protein